MEAEEIVARLRDELSAAMRSRDTTAVAVLRSTLAAIANAEAVAPNLTVSPGEKASPSAGAVLGAGAADVARRRLGPREILAVVRSEIAERESAARDYESLGREANARVLRDEAQVLEGLAQRLDLV